MIKKIILSTTVASLCLAASTSELIDNAMKHYQNKEYAKALSSFEQISGYQNISGVDYYIGRSHYELGNYEQALIAYDRFLINNPNHKRAQLEIAQTYYMLGLYDEAMPRFNELMSDPEIPEVVKQNIQLRIASIKSNQTPHNYQVTAIFGLGYDNNINNTTDTSSYNLPGLGNLPVTPAEKKSSLFYDTGLIVNHIYTHNEDLALRNSFTVYHQNYEKTNSKRTSLFSLSTAPVFQLYDSNIMLRFGYDRVWYAGDSYLNSFHFTPSLSKAIDTNKLYNLSLNITKKEFATTYENKDSLQYDLTNRFMVQTNSTGIFSFDFSIGKEDRKGENDPYVSHSSYELKVSNRYQLNQELTLGSSIAYKDTKYSHSSAVFQSKRDDERYNLGLNLGYRYNKNATFGISYNYINQDSNHAAFDYDKNVVKTYLYYTF